MKYIGIIAAMDEEMEEIRKKMKDTKIIVICNLKFIAGKIENKNCLLVKSGVGKVNAARTIQILISNFEIEYVINVGVAGATNMLLNIGDVVIAKYVVQHDFDITAFGHSKGYVAGLGDKVICDSEMVNKFETLIKKKDERNYNVKIGIVASGDIFCTDIDMKNQINKEFNADVVDMECAAIGQVCCLDNIPFISIRSVSDIPNGENVNVYEENLELAAKRCADVLNEFCSQ